MELVDSLKNNARPSKINNDKGLDSTQENSEKQSNGLLSDSKTIRAQMIREAFSKCNADLKKAHFDVSLSGSTAVSVLLIGRLIICANVGDSRAVLGSYFQSQTNKPWVAVPLSRDHKPNLPDEKKRILMHKGRVEPFKGI